MLMQKQIEYGTVSMVVPTGVSLVDTALVWPVYRHRFSFSLCASLSSTLLCLPGYLIILVGIIFIVLFPLLGVLCL